MKPSLLFTIVFSFLVINISAQVTPPGGHNPPPSSPIELHFDFDQAGNQIKRNPFKFIRLILK